jgi:hypothetical protein
LGAFFYWGILPIKIPVALGHRRANKTVALRERRVGGSMFVIDWKRVPLEDIGVCPVCFQSTFRGVCSNCHYWWPYRGYATRPTQKEIEEAARKSYQKRQA